MTTHTNSRNVRFLRRKVTYRCGICMAMIGAGRALKSHRAAHMRNGEGGYWEHTVSLLTGKKERMYAPTGTPAADWMRFPVWVTDPNFL